MSALKYTPRKTIAPIEVSGGSDEVGPHSVGLARPPSLPKPGQTRQVLALLWKSRALGNSRIPGKSPRIFQES